MSRLMSYIDGFLIPLPKKNIASYRKMAKGGAKVWIRHGALHYIEAVADDLFPPGIVNTFAKVAKLKADETLIFAFIVFQSRAHRDRVNKKVMRDADMDPSKYKQMPFDMKRMAYGGFKTLVSGEG